MAKANNPAFKKPKENGRSSQENTESQSSTKIFLGFVTLDCMRHSFPRIIMIIFTAEYASALSDSGLVCNEYNRFTVHMFEFDRLSHAHKNLNTEILRKKCLRKAMFVLAVNLRVVRYCSHDG